MTNSLPAFRPSAGIDYPTVDNGRPVAPRFFHRKAVVLEENTSNFFDFRQRALVDGLAKRSVVLSERSLKEVRNHENHLSGMST